MNPDGSVRQLTQTGSIFSNAMPAGPVAPQAQTLPYAPGPVQPQTGPTAVQPQSGPAPNGPGLSSLQQQAQRARLAVLAQRGPASGQPPPNAPAQPGLVQASGTALAPGNLSNQPTYTASPIRAPGPAPTPIYQGPASGPTAAPAQTLNSQIAAQLAQRAQAQAAAAAPVAPGQPTATAARPTPIAGPVQPIATAARPTPIAGPAQPITTVDPQASLRSFAATHGGMTQPMWTAKLAKESPQQAAQDTALAANVPIGGIQSTDPRYSVVKGMVSSGTPYLGNGNWHTNGAGQPDYTPSAEEQQMRLTLGTNGNISQNAIDIANYMKPGSGDALSKKYNLSNQTALSMTLNPTQTNQYYNSYNGLDNSVNSTYSKYIDAQQTAYNNWLANYNAQHKSSGSGGLFGDVNNILNGNATGADWTKAGTQLASLIL